MDLFRVFKNNTFNKLNILYQVYVDESVRETTCNVETTEVAQLFLEDCLSQVALRVEREFTARTLMEQYHAYEMDEAEFAEFAQYLDERIAVSELSV